MDRQLTPEQCALLGDVVSTFRLGDLMHAERWGSGHINDSYRATTSGVAGPRHTLVQRINQDVFPDPLRLTASIARVTEHLRGKVVARGLPDPSRRVLALLESTSKEVCWQHPGDGTWWRVYAFVPGARTYDQVTSPAMAYDAALAFGAFQRDLADLPPPRLAETLPGFHDSRGRFAALHDAVAADTAGRVRTVGPDVEFALAREPMTPVLLDALAAGAIPERITHNDTKINNVLFDDRSGEAICVIDLDTVMPGIGLYDFGDLVRTCTSSTPEDERDVARIHADPRRFEALVAGYLHATGDVLTPTERELMPFSGRLITYQIGIRFLTDYLRGDAYFRIARPDQNLDRARAQFALLRSLEAQEDAFARKVKRLAGSTLPARSHRETETGQ